MNLSTNPNSPYTILELQVLVLNLFIVFFHMCSSGHRRCIWACKSSSVSNAGSNFVFVLKPQHWQNCLVIIMYRYLHFTTWELQGFTWYTMFKTSLVLYWLIHELVKVVFTHAKQALLWTLLLFTSFHLQFTSVESFHFTLNRSVHVYNYIPFWQIRIILIITKAKTNKKFDCYSCYLVLIYTVCFKFETQLISQKLT